MATGSPRVGHLVRERNGEVLCALPGIRDDERVQTFPDSMEIIHPDAGVRMSRLRTSRPVVPHHILRLKSMCMEAAQDGHGLSAKHALGEVCVVCASSLAGARCPVCLSLVPRPLR